VKHQLDESLPVDVECTVGTYNSTRRRLRPSIIKRLRYWDMRLAGLFRCRDGQVDDFRDESIEGIGLREHRLGPRNETGHSRRQVPHVEAEKRLATLVQLSEARVNVIGDDTGYSS
jgi:hypothetical protein